MTILRVYPPAWRARYGDELATLIEELGGGWRVRLDVVRGGLAERVRALGLRGRDPRAQAREGAILVLYAWTLFVLGGCGIAKAAEHWQETTPAGDHALPAAAYDALVVGAAVGSAFVLLGVALVLPKLGAALAQRHVRRRIARAALLGLLFVGATAGLAAWAHSLAEPARNGRDAAYSGAFAAWVVLVAATLFAWAAAAAAAARAVPLPDRLLRLEARLAGGVTACMAVMTGATAVWWASVHGYGLVANVVVPVAAMVCATALGLAGAARASLISRGLRS
jgi:hypothetical protein